MPKRNVELLKRLRTRLLRIRHKKHFNMNDVAVKTDCGAALCLAGHTLELAGYKRKYVGDWLGDSGDYVWFTPSGRRVPDAVYAAQRLLGLNHDEARLCAYDNRDSGLFMRFDLKTPKQAAKVLEQFIE